MEALERLKAMPAFCGKRLGGSDPLTIIPDYSGSAAGLAAAFEAQKSEIEAFVSDRNVAHLTNANANADSALVNYLAQIPGISSSEELIGLIQTISSYRSSLEEQERVADRVPDTTGKNPCSCPIYFRAAQRGHSIEETADKLLEVSARAQERARLHDEAMHASRRKMQLRRQSVDESGAGGRQTGPNTH